MHLSEFIISSLLLITFVLLQTDFSKTSDGIHECLGSDTFTSNDSYEENLDELTSFISQYTPDGFRNLSMADDNGQYKVYVSVLCFGNTSAGDCGDCVRRAIAQIRGLCPYNKAAVIWFGACHVKYSNNDFSGQIDNKVRCDVAPQNVTNPKSFYKWTKYLLNVLVVNASAPENTLCSQDSSGFLWEGT